MNNTYTTRQMALINKLRQLWSQHVYWTRFFIISTVDDLADLASVTNRLLQNPRDFVRVLSVFYPPEITNHFQELLTQHLLIAADLVNSSKNNEKIKAENTRKKWYANADDIAEFLSDINPYWNRQQWENMLYSHLEMTEKEVALRLDKKYEEDIDNFDNIESQAMAMADYMAGGIIQQFQYR